MNSPALLLSVFYQSMRPEHTCKHRLAAKCDAILVTFNAKCDKSVVRDRTASFFGGRAVQRSQQSNDNLTI